MKLEIWNTEETKQEEPVRLALKEAYDGFNVVAVDTDGVKIHQGKLIQFKLDGTIHRYPCVNGDLGFELDSSGRIRLHGDDCGDC